MKSFRRVSVTILGFAFVAFLAGGTYTYLLSSDRTREVLKNLQKFAKVYEIVKKNYVHLPEDQTLVDGAISGMLTALDPHSVYLKKEDFAEMQADTKGEFGGLGIEISKRDGLLTVVSPIEDTPAARAGLQSGDIIVRIEEEPTMNMSVIDAVKLMRGKVGEPINISVKREGVDNLMPFTIVRAVIKVQSVRHEVKDGFGVIRVRQFLERTSDELREAIEDIRKQGALDGLVLDLRNNPGGLLSQAIEVSDLFLEEGLIVYTQGREEDKVVRNYATSKGIDGDFPVAVVINGGSASASEIVAGALQDQGRGHIIGVQSFGKGSVQNVIPLDDGSGVKLTVALYYTPSGRQIQGAGIIPDQVVRGPNDPLEGIRERDLPGHIVGEEEEEAKKLEEAQKKKAEEAKNPSQKVSETATEQEPEDIQLQAALDYLKKQVAQANSGR